MRFRVTARWLSFAAAAWCVIGGSPPAARGAASDSTPRPPRHETLARELSDLADTLERSGRWDEGLRLLSAAIDTLSNEMDATLAVARLKVASAKILRARSFYQNAGFAETQALLRDACRAAEVGNDRGLLADCLHQTGASQYSQALWAEKPDFTAALENHRKALDIRRSLRDMRGVSESLFSLGLLRERAGDPAGALRLYEESLRISRPRRFRVEMSYAIRHVAGIAEEEGKLDRALPLFKESLALREASGFRVGIPFADLAVGDVLRKKGDATGAATHYDRALGLAQELDLKVAIVFAHISRAELHESTGDPRSAAVSYERALESARSFEFRPGVEAASAGLARLKGGER